VAFFMTSAVSESPGRTPIHREPAPYSPDPKLHLFAKLTAVSAFFVLFAGGMVTSTGSGLAVPDWPLSFGQYMPEMIGGVFFEHGHRMIAGIVAVMTWVLAVWVWRREPRRWMKLTAAAAAFFIVVQAVLGGVTVLYGLPPQVSIAHACLGQALFCSLAAMAQATSPSFMACVPSGEGKMWRFGALAVGAVFIQLILGAVMRHTGAGQALLFHFLWAFAAAGAVLYAAFRALALPSHPLGMAGLSAAMAGGVLAQMFLGVGALWARSARAIVWSAYVPTLHQATGALILVGSVLWTLRAHRRDV
jgi:cytochrome c oxidase assembly protein subunit 15